MSGVTGSGLKFIVIDDDQDILDIETALLTKEGHQVITLIESKTAFEKIKEERKKHG